MTTKHTLSVTAIIEYEGRFLFIKRRGDVPNFPNKRVFPWGKVELGEDVIQALTRELQEETGLQIAENYTLLSSYQFTREEDQSSSIGLVFLVHALNDAVVFDDESFSEYEWIQPEDILEYDSIYGMEAHVRNAIYALKHHQWISRDWMSITHFQKNNHQITREELQALQW